jgi:hypothetical protein
LRDENSPILLFAPFQREGGRGMGKTVCYPELTLD